MPKINIFGDAYLRRRFVDGFDFWFERECYMSSFTLLNFIDRDVTMTTRERVKNTYF